MKYPKTLAALLSLLGLLLVAAVSPSRTAELVGNPFERYDEWKAQKAENEREALRQARWESLQAAASSGNADSLARVGFQYLYGRIPGLPNMEPDSARGSRLIHEAADQGSIIAAYHLWQNGMAPIDRLRELESSPRAADFPDLFDWAFATQAISSCDLTLLSASFVHNRRAPLKFEQTDARQAEELRLMQVSGWIGTCADAADPNDIEGLRRDVNTMKDSLRTAALGGAEAALHSLVQIEVWGCNSDAVAELPSLIEAMPVDEANRTRLRSVFPITNWPEHCTLPATR